ncbi:MAG: trehalose-phosphatase [Syntrophobacteraceae bacterium]
MKIGVSSPVKVINAPDFWSRVSRSEHRLLGLDYDGTLAPFHVDPLQAYPMQGISAFLQALSEARNTTAAIISGRPVEEVAVFLGNVGVTLIGCHGFEIIHPDGNLTVRSPTGNQIECMEKAIDAAFRLGIEEKLEVKTGSVALHTRGMPPGEAAQIEEMISQEWLRLTLFDLGCRRFNGGIEIYCNGWNKAEAFKELLGSLPPETLPVYVGDDATDEDVFRILLQGGIGIRVGSPETPTAAKGFLPDCEAVRAFLGAWLSLEASERSLAENGNRKTCSCLKPPADSGALRH